MELVQSVDTRPIVARHLSAVRAIAVSNDGHRIATADVDRILRIWVDGVMDLEVDLHVHLRRFKAIDIIRAIRFADDGKSLYVASGEIIRAMDPSTGDIQWSFDSPVSYGFLITTPQSIATTHSGHLAVALDNGSVGVWSEEGAKLKHWYDNDAPRFLEFMSDGERIVGSDGFSITTWHAPTGKKLKRTYLQDRTYGFAYTAKYGVAAVRSLYQVTLLNPETEVKLCDFSTHAGLPGMEFSPTQRLLAVGDARGISTVGFDGQIYDRHDTFESPVLCAAFSPDGKSLFAGCSDGNVYSWPVDVPCAVLA